MIKGVAVFPFWQQTGVFREFLFDFGKIIAIETRKQVMVESRKSAVVLGNGE